MKVTCFKEAENYEPEKDWKRVSLCNEQRVSVEYFIKPPLHSSPLHKHESDQVIVVIKGKMSVISASGEEKVLNEGDSAHFASNELHAVKNYQNTPSVGIDIFAPGRSFDFWFKRKQAGSFPD